MKHRTIRGKLLAVAGMSAAAALVLAGCASGPAPGPTDEAPTTPEPLSIATVMPGTSTPAIVLGIDAGIYEKHMIDLTETTAPSGVSNLVIGGEVDIAAPAWVPAIIAASQGVPLVAVSHAGSYVGPGLHGWFVGKDSGIASGKDLEGKTVAMNAMGSLGEIAIREYVVADGGDPEAVRFTELAFPDMIPALAQGNIDAAWLPGPFYMAGMGDDSLVLLTDFADIASVKGLPNVGYFSMQEWAGKNKPLLTRFNAALSESLAYVNADESLVRQMQIDVGGLPEGLAAVIALEPHTTDLPRESVQRLIDLMLKWGLIDLAPDLSKLFPEQL
ncbi:MAG TPA: ABC transporter substrate-binding protein [Microbacteriaceae bacterium]|nr:ABC transporter substrate-binding protein [Microbacteriaceae bacterium]